MEASPKNADSSYQDLYVVHSQKQTETNDDLDNAPKVFSFKNSGSVNLSSFFGKWRRLITNPFKDNHQEEATIYDIFKEDMPIHELVKMVLVQKDKLHASAQELQDAVLESNKIFHEDYPGDFILEFKGERLGMFILNNPRAGEEALNYIFKPGLKSFKWR